MGPPADDWNRNINTAKKASARLLTAIGIFRIYTSGPIIRLLLAQDLACDGG